MKTKLIVILITTLTLLYFNIAYSKCKKSWVCDDYGMNCKIMDVCDNSLDLPSIDIRPLYPLPSTKIKPLPSLKIPPIGTKKCRWMQVNGQWKNICIPYNSSFNDW